MLYPEPPRFTTDLAKMHKLASKTYAFCIRKVERKKTLYFSAIVWYYDITKKNTAVFVKKENEK